MSFLRSKPDLPPPPFDLHQTGGALQLRKTVLSRIACLLTQTLRQGGLTP
jgi:hypothetical protein